MKQSLVRAALPCLLGGLLSFAALPAHADINSAINAYGEQKYDAAYREFSQLATQGDNRAKSFLALMTLRGLGTARDVKQGAKLARECAEGGEPTCAAIYGDLNLPGKGLPVNFPEARAGRRRLRPVAGLYARSGQPVHGQRQGRRPQVQRHRPPHHR